MIGLLLGFGTGQAGAVEPGVDIAVPRVAITTVDDFTLMFHPANLAIEQGDYVRWQHTGSSLCHTTTSGGVCNVPSGLWNVTLGPSTCLPSPAVFQFTRQFADPPGAIPFYCSPHCGLGMRGSVTVTTLIDVTAKDVSGTLTLGWTGGGGSYVVYRSDNPAFTGPATVKLSPDAGSPGTTFTDVTEPLPGQVSYYLVMNLF